jgi:hypothetical protein
MRWEALAMCLLALGGAGLGLVQACNSSTVAAVDGGPDAVPVCLASVQEQNGQACEAPDGYACPTTFSCTDSHVEQLANCVCANGKWSCSYTAAAFDGAVIAPGSAPTCISDGHGDPAACPASDVTATQGGPEGGALPCAVANAGLLCSYDSGVTCPDAGFPSIVTCQCIGDSDGGLVFACDPVVCEVEPADAAVDSPPEATADAGRDAATDGD